MTGATEGTGKRTEPKDDEQRDPESVSAARWLARFSEALGLAAPSQQEFDELLGLAGIAAHASERTAAPLSTWLVGRAGVAAADAKAIALQLARTIETQDGG